jgi:hypothetical protein
VARVVYEHVVVKQLLRQRRRRRRLTAAGVAVSLAVRVRVRRRQRARARRGSRGAGGGYHLGRRAPGRVRGERARRQRGAHQHRLAARIHRLARVLLQARQVARKHSVQQLVRLVDDERAHVVRLQVPKQRQLRQPPGRAHHQHGLVAPQRVQLAPHVGAANGLRHILPAGGAKQRLGLAHNLDGQLLRRRHHDAQHVVRRAPPRAGQRGALRLEAGGQQRQQVRCEGKRTAGDSARNRHRTCPSVASARTERLAGARLALHRRVLAAQQCGHRRRLRARGRCGVSAHTQSFPRALSRDPTVPPCCCWRGGVPVSTSAASGPVSPNTAPAAATPGVQRQRQGSTRHVSGRALGLHWPLATSVRGCVPRATRTLRVARCCCSSASPPPRRLRQRRAQATRPW